MWIHTLVLVNVILQSTFASYKETLNSSHVIKRDKHNLRGSDGKSSLQKFKKWNVNFRDARNVRFAENQLISDGRRKEMEHTDRRKRSWGAVFTGITAAIRLTGLGLTLAQTLTEGCFYYPSICTNKNRMEDLERRLVPMRAEYDKLYLRNKKEYISILTTNTNNAYISYYINQTFMNIENLQDIEKFLSEKLESQFPKLKAMYKGSEYYTSKEYLDIVVGNLQNRISDIKNSLKDERNKRLKWLLYQYLIEATVGTFISSFAKAYTKVTENNAKMNKQIGQYLKSQMKIAKQNQVAAGKSGVKQNYNGKYNQGSNGKIKQTWSKKISEKIKTMKGKARLLKNKMKFAMREMAKTKIKSMKNAFKVMKNPKLLFNNKVAPKTAAMKQLEMKNAAIKQDVGKITSKTKTAHNNQNGKGLTKTTVVLGVLSIIADIVSHVSAVFGWKKKADEVQSARDDYETHYLKFSKELDGVRKESSELAKRWPEVLTMFTRSTSVFKTLLEGSKNYTSFNKTVGISQLPMNTSDPIFDIDFESINRKNIQSAQGKVLSFIKDIDNDIMKVVDKMYARKVMFEMVLTMTDETEAIDDIFELITKTLKFSKLKTVKEFGNKLTKKDLICTISVLRRDLMVYDFFPLNDFRPRCNLSIDNFKNKEQMANIQRNEKLMKDIVIKTLKTDTSQESVSDLTSHVKTAYLGKDSPVIQAYGDKLNDKDVLCTIATEFQSKQTYDFISLSPFRPDCEKVNISYFLILKQDAKVVRYLSSKVKSIVEWCSFLNMCPCPLQIAFMISKELKLPAKKQVSKDQVINAIRIQFPAMKQYCGVMGCDCVKFT